MKGRRERPAVREVKKCTQVGILARPPPQPLPDAHEAALRPTTTTNPPTQQGIRHVGPEERAVSTDSSILHGTLKITSPARTSWLVTTPRRKPMSSSATAPAAGLSPPPPTSSLHEVGGASSSSSSCLLLLASSSSSPRPTTSLTFQRSSHDLYLARRRRREGGRGRESARERRQRRSQDFARPATHASTGQRLLAVSQLRSRLAAQLHSGISRVSEANARLYPRQVICGETALIRCIRCRALSAARF